MIPLAEVRRRVDGGEHCRNLFAVHEGQHRLRGALAWDRQNPLAGDRKSRTGIGQGKMREGPDGSQTRVAGTHGITTDAFEMVEKSQNIVGSKLTEGEPINRLGMLFGEELQQDPKSITVGFNRQRADITLGSEMLGKETFGENGEGIGSHSKESLVAWFFWPS